MNKKIEFSFKAIRIIEDTLNAVQQADEIEGLDLNEYVLVMMYLSDELKAKSQIIVNKIIED